MAVLHEIPHTLTFSYSDFFLLSVWVSVFVLNPINVSCGYNAPSPLSSSVCFLKNKDIIKIRKIMLIQLVFRYHSDFTSCPNNVLY